MKIYHLREGPCDMFLNEYSNLNGIFIQLLKYIFSQRIVFVNALKTHLVEGQLNRVIMPHLSSNWLFVCFSRID